MSLQTKENFRSDIAGLRAGVNKGQRRTEHPAQWQVQDPDGRREKSLKRPQAIEPIIGHLKANHRMNQCFLKGSKGDSLHAVLFAAGYNFLWLRRMIVKKGIDLFLLLPQTSGLGKISRQ